MANPVIRFMKELALRKKSSGELSKELLSCKKPLDAEIILDYIKKRGLSPEMLQNLFEFMVELSSSRKFTSGSIWSPAMKKAAYLMASVPGMSRNLLTQAIALDQHTLTEQYKSQLKVEVSQVIAKHQNFSQASSYLNDVLKRIDSTAGSLASDRIRGVRTAAVACCFVSGSSELILELYSSREHFDYSIDPFKFDEIEGILCRGFAVLFEMVYKKSEKSKEPYYFSTAVSCFEKSGEEGLFQLTSILAKGLFSSHHHKLLLQVLIDSGFIHKVTPSSRIKSIIWTPTSFYGRLAYCHITKDTRFNEEIMKELCDGNLACSIIQEYSGIARQVLPAEALYTMLDDVVKADMNMLTNHSNSRGVRAKALLRLQSFKNSDVLNPKYLREYLNLHGKYGFVHGDRSHEDRWYGPSNDCHEDHCWHTDNKEVHNEGVL